MATASGTARELIPDTAGLRALREAAGGCRACELWRRGTQTVFGEGSARARMMLVGEQPGDREDLAGEPFVGPAGRLLDRALEDAGIERGDAYVTNAVKHFKWKAKGKRRIHDKPNEREIVACQPWLDAELEVVQPEIVVAMGATAARSLLGRDFRLTHHRGELVPWDREPLITATMHPSAVLRGPDERRKEAYEALVADLTVAVEAIDGP